MICMARFQFVWSWMGGGLNLTGSILGKYLFHVRILEWASKSLKSSTRRATSDTQRAHSYEVP